MIKQDTKSKIVYTTVKEKIWMNDSSFDVSSSMGKDIDLGLPYFCNLLSNTQIEGGIALKDWIRKGQL